MENDETDDKQLTIAEEILLLLLHDEDGSFARVPEWALRYALSGSILIELAFAGRIDNDLHELVIVSDESMNDPVLDGLLEDIKNATEPQSARYWVERSAALSDDVRDAALNRLIDRGILEQREERFLWVFKSRRYPVVDGHAEKEVKLRIMEVLFSDVIPAPRDVVLICLCQAVGILGEIFTSRELDLAVDRIDQIRKLDLIGQAVIKAIWDIEVSFAVASQPQLY